jgi:hypothetical protein
VVGWWKNVKDGEVVGRWLAREVGVRREGVEVRVKVSMELTHCGSSQ